MPAQKRELYTSPNGDRWYLARQSETGRLFVRHKANVPSGGQVTDIDIGAFLSGGRRHPEHQALLYLIGTLVESDPQRIARRSRWTRQSQRSRSQWGDGRPDLCPEPERQERYHDPRRPVPNRRSGSRFSTGRSPDFRSLTEQICGNALLRSTSASVISERYSVTALERRHPPQLSVSKKSHPNSRGTARASYR